MGSSKLSPLKIIIGVIVLIFCIQTCSKRGSNSSSSSSGQKYVESPVDKLIKGMSTEQNFTIVLYDMDYTEGDNIYRHQYDVIRDVNDSVVSERTVWYPVTDQFFQANIENMGMEIASKIDGKVSKVASPAGHSNYVGNEKYGHWEQRNGGSFWAFYGRYAFMSSMFRMATYPVQRSSWNSYRSDYYGQGRPYYGSSSNGRNMYGTNSNYSKSNSSSKWNSKPATFKSSVRSKVSQSSAKSRTAATKQTTKQTTRSSSRYSGSSTRSRGGGSGK